MARALLGHLSTTADRHLVEEVARLRGRIKELETEIAELKAEKLKVKLPSGVGSTTFDRSTGEYLVTSAESNGEVL